LYLTILTLLHTSAALNYTILTLTLITANLYHAIVKTKLRLLEKKVKIKWEKSQNCDSERRKSE